MRYIKSSRNKLDSTRSLPLQLEFPSLLVPEKFIQLVWYLWVCQGAHPYNETP